MQREEKGRTGDERYRLKTVKSGSTVSSVQPVKRVSLSLSLFLSLFSNVASLCPTSPLDAQSDKRRIPAREKRARRTAWRIAAAVRSPGWFVNRPIAMTTMCVYVCVCVRVCVCVLAVKGAAKIARFASFKSVISSRVGTRVRAVGERKPLSRLLERTTSQPCNEKRSPLARRGETCFVESHFSKRWCGGAAANSCQPLEHTSAGQRTWQLLINISLITRDRNSRARARRLFALPA